MRGFIDNASYGVELHEDGKGILRERLERLEEWCGEPRGEDNDAVIKKKVRGELELELEEEEERDDVSMSDWRGEDTDDADSGTEEEQESQIPEDQNS